MAAIPWLAASWFGRGRSAALAVVLALTSLLVAPAGASAATVTTHTGSLADGATYKIQVPDPFNGTLLLYSHGYVAPWLPNPAEDAGDPATAAYLLAHGYALAGSSYATKGWAIHEAIPDQIATLDLFSGVTGEQPARTIAWGHSLGGIITAGLLQEHPDRFAGAMPMCGVVAGGVGTWNEALDGQFAIQQLLPGGAGLQVVHITNPNNLAAAEAVLAAAQATPQGRARIALAAALADLPGWFNPASPEPASGDFAAREQNQYEWLTQVDAPFLFLLRGELEARAGGNPSWNTGVDYAKQLGLSIDSGEVAMLYSAAGLSLDSDLAKLAAAPRITADPGALAYLRDNVTFDGQLAGKPVLTVHTTGDGLVVDEEEQAYRSVVLDAKDGQLLREAFVHRAGHCAFTPAETVAALDALVSRIDTGSWTGHTDPSRLDAAAAALGALNVAPPAFVGGEPAPFLRPYDSAPH